MHVRAPWCLLTVSCPGNFLARPGHVHASGQARGRHDRSVTCCTCFFSCVRIEPRTMVDGAGREDEAFMLCPLSRTSGQTKSLAVGLSVPRVMFRSSPPRCCCLCTAYAPSGPPQQTHSPASLPHVGVPRSRNRGWRERVGGTRVGRVWEGGQPWVGSESVPGGKRGDPQDSRQAGQRGGISQGPPQTGECETIHRDPSGVGSRGRLRAAPED